MIDNDKSNSFINQFDLNLNYLFIKTQHINSKLKNLRITQYSKRTMNSRDK